MVLLAWTIDSLGLARLEVGPGDAVQTNAVVRELGGATGADGLHAATRALCAVLGSDESRTELAEAIERAKSGTSTVVHAVGGRPGVVWRVLCESTGPGTASIVAVPPDLTASASMLSQALAARAAAGVAHEASNALTAILGWTRLARETGSTSDALTHIETNAAVARDTLRMLLSTTSPRRASEAPSAQSVPDVLREVLRLLRPLAHERNCEVVSKCPRDATVLGTRVDLWTAIWNLVQNALEATPRGGAVRITVTMRRNRVEVRVRDDGEGVAKEHRARLFEPYYTTKATGTGLGLALVRRAAERLGGEVTLAPESGSRRGATFVLDLPRLVTHEMPETSVHSSGVRRSLPELAMRVLLVENDESIRTMLQMALGLCGVETTAVATCAEADALEGEWDMAVVDLNLPDGRGDELVARLTARGAARATVIATGSEPASVACAPTAWLRKPFDVTELIELLQTHGARPPSERKASRRAKAR